MKNLNLILIVFTLMLPAHIYASSLAFSVSGGYAPSVGGSMHSGWQAENLGVTDGINDINRSSSSFQVSTVEKPVGIAAGADIRYISGAVYFGAGADFLYTMWGGSGRTVNAADTEVVEVNYSQWACCFPVYGGVSLLFWGETRISAGAGIAFAYGNCTGTFKSSSLDHEGSFTAWALPLFWELRGERMLTDSLSLMCRIAYYTGESRTVEDGDDYGRVDFTGYLVNAGIVKYLNF